MGFPSLRGNLSDVGAFKPTFGAGETSFFSGVFQDANSFQKSDLGSSAVVMLSFGIWRSTAGMNCAYGLDLCSLLADGLLFLCLVFENLRS